MAMAEQPPWDEDGLCIVCPGLVLGPGEFDVERPASDLRYDPARGYRCAPSGVPVCMHPDKIGVPPGRYLSDGAPWPGQISGRR